jgi:hypothetical protein
VEAEATARAARAGRAVARSWDREDDVVTGKVMDVGVQGWLGSYVLRDMSWEWLLRVDDAGTGSRAGSRNALSQGGMDNCKLEQRSRCVDAWTKNDSICSACWWEDEGAVEALCRTPVWRSSSHSNCMEDSYDLRETEASGEANRIHGVPSACRQLGDRGDMLIEIGGD